MSATEAKQDTYPGTMAISLAVEERKPFDKYQIASMEQAVLSQVWRELHILLQGSLLIVMLIVLTETTVQEPRLKTDYLYPLVDGSVFAFGLLLVGCGYWLAFGVRRHPAGGKSQNSRTSRRPFPHPYVVVVSHVVMVRSDSLRLVLTLCVLSTTLIFSMIRLTPEVTESVECERGVRDICYRTIWSRMVSWILPVVLAQVYVLFRIRVR